MRVLPVIALIPTLSSPAATPEVARHRTAGSDFPVASAVEVQGNVSMVHLSGVSPPLSRSDLGDTRAQTMSVLGTIEATLHRLQLDLGDIVRMQVFLVGDPLKDGRMDFEGFMEAYRTFFGTPIQPNLPVRTVFQVAALSNPDWLVEIEVSAARPRKAA
ncbi:RidA family protein [Falsiroseomonas sp. HW251]|uniref:RidA family protein n=1 Tax=Falsiroseomonas sp. HW251 TaxID=3390998 RepID=UPI003D31C627